MSASRPSRPTSPGVRWAVLGLSAANLAVVALMWALSRPAAAAGSHLAVSLSFAVLFAGVGALPIRLEFSQHRAAFALNDAVLAAALFHLGGPWLALAAGVGELGRGLLTRSPAVKTAFNSTSHAATAAVAAQAFAVLGGSGVVAPLSWMYAVVAVLCGGVLNAASVSAVLAAAEGRSFQKTLVQSLPTALATTILGAPVGVLVAELWSRGPAYPLLVAPLGLGVWLNNRYAAGQRDEHLRVERLYQATARTAQLAADTDVLAVVADEARQLLTGHAAVCCVRRGDAPWAGRTARPGGPGGARTSDIEALVELAATVEPGGAGTAAVPPLFHRMVPEADTMVLARSPRGAAAEMVIAVFRKRRGDSGDGAGLGETLAAFTAHGAAIAANSELVSMLQRSLESQLEANHRKDEFVATISHELRTPLTVMLGAAQTVLRRDDRLGRTDRDRLLRTAVDQGQRLRLLIEDLLLVAAAEQGRLSADMDAMSTAELAGELGSDLPESLAARVTISDLAGDSAVLTDRYKLRQIVTNLIQNAAKYAPGSPIEVVLSALPDRVRISVADHGPGIPEQDRERVFDRFVQLDQSSTRAQGGTGLGLFICRKLAEQLNSSLQLRQTDGGGCTFDLEVPRCRRSRLQDDATQGDGTNAQRGRAPAGLLRRPAVQAPLPVPSPRQGALP